MSIFREMWDKLGTPSTALRSPGDWNPKLPPARLDASLSSLYYLDFNSRETELGPDYAPGPHPGGHSLIFQEGQWVLQQGPQGANGRSSKARDRTRIHRLKNMNRGLQEENNALKLRVELLMDMLAETTAQLQGSDPGEGAARTA